MKFLFAFMCLWGSVGLGLTKATAADLPPVVYLGLPSQGPGQPGLLLRELHRQALLIAARNELGLYTRDAALREWDPAAPVPADAQGKPALRMVVKAAGQAAQLNVDTFLLDADKTHLETDTTDVTIFEHSMPLISESLAQCEALSCGKFVDLLQHQGYSANIKPDGDAPLSKDEQALLYQTELLATFAAVQRIDADIAAGGESPDRLGGLVRAYANLGELTRFQWSDNSKIMTARALLYAQRLVRKYPQSPLSYYHRAYAFTFAGMHAAALKDLDTAAELEKNDKIDKPAWVRLLDPACKHNLMAIIHNLGANDPLTPVATLLLFMDNENCGSTLHIMATGEVALKSNPECFRIIDGMCAVAGVSAGHTLTEQAQRLMLGTIGKQMGLLPTVPGNVQEALKKMDQQDPIGSIAAQCDSLVTARDLAEPSYALAGRILQETNFAQVERRAHFMARSWGVDCSEYVQAMQPLIANHPMAGYIESLQLPQSRQGDGLKQLHVIDMKLVMKDLLADAIASRLPELIQLYRQAMANMDDLPWDVEPILGLGASANPQQIKLGVKLATQLRAVSPYSPRAIAELIHFDWANTEPKLAELTQYCQDDPAVLQAIGQQYLAAGKDKEAKAAYEKLVEVAPDYQTCEVLANMYLADGDEDKWLSTMKIVLTEPDYELTHSKIEEIIAWHYINTGRYDEARPYADASYKDSGAFWAMEVDAVAAEYQGDFATAEALRKEQSERYENAGWYLWCKRTGHGDEAAARKQADAFVAQCIAVNNPAKYLDIAMVMDLEHRLSEARRYYRAEMQRTHLASIAFRLADICDEMKDKDARKEALQFAVDHCNATANGHDTTLLCNMAQLMLDAGDTWPTKDDFNKICVQMDANQAAVALFSRGRQFELAGKHDLALEEYRHVLKYNQYSLPQYILSCEALRAEGEKTELVKYPPSFPVKKPE